MQTHYRAIAAMVLTLILTSAACGTGEEPATVSGPPLSLARALSTSEAATAEPSAVPRVAFTLAASPTERPIPLATDTSAPSPRPSAGTPVPAEEAPRSKAPAPASAATSTPVPSLPRAPQAVTLLDLDQVDELRQMFNADEGVPRLVMLLSPT